MEYLVAVICLALAIATSVLVSRWLPPPALEGRFVAIDGLRGYLALSVFIHHGALWLGRRRDGGWATPQEHLLAHLGHDSVALFFMITAFLFTTKLLEAPPGPINWAALFIGRVMRLVPLYLLVMLVVALIVGHLTQWHLAVSPLQLLNQLVHWWALSVAGLPDINGVPDTLLIVAGVPWSLAYEVMFYLALPLLAWALGRRVPGGWLLFAGVGAAACFHYNHRWPWLLAFLAGIATAFIARSPVWRARAASSGVALVALGTAALAIWGLPDGKSTLAVLAMAMLFVPVACGHTLWGLLAHRWSRTLGEMAYSIYLLHGLLLYLSFSAALPQPDVGFWEHWLAVGLLTPVLVIVSSLSLRFVEQPGMRSTRRVVAWLQRRGLVRP